MSFDIEKYLAEYKESDLWTKVETLSTPGQARMPLDVFQSLGEYSATLPSGTYLGKRWRALRDDGWWMGEYEERYPDGIHIKIRWREIWINSIKSSLPFTLPFRATFQSIDSALEAIDSYKRLGGT